MVYQYINKYSWPILVLMLFLTTACFKQDVPEIQENSVKRAELKSCEGVKLTGGILEHYNLTRFLDCTGLNQDYPHLTKAIKSISSESWDHLTKPLDKILFYTDQKTTLFIQIIKSLDKAGGLKDLAALVNSFLNMNFNDVACRIMNLANDGNVQVCQNAEVGQNDAKKISKEDLKKLLRVLDTENDFVEELLEGGSDLLRAITLYKDEFSFSIRQLINEERFNVARKEFISTLFINFKEDLFEGDKKFILSKLFTKTYNKNDHYPYFYKWTVDPNMTYPIYKGGTTFFAHDYPEIIEHSRIIKNKFGEKLYCQYRGEKSHMYVDIEGVFKKFISMLEVNEYDEYFTELFQYLSGGIIGDPSCNFPTTFRDDTGVNIFDNTAKLGALLTEPFYFEFVKFLQKLSVENGVNKNPLFLLEVLSTKALQAIINVKALFIEEKDGKSLEHANYQIARAIKFSTFASIGTIVGKMAKDENAEMISVVGKIWDLLTEHEKDSIIGTMDANFIGENGEDVNFIELFKFYLDFAKTYYRELPSLNESYAGSDEIKEITFQALREFSIKMQGPQVLNDLRKAMDRDQIIKILRLIATGVPDREEEDVLRLDKTRETELVPGYVLLPDPQAIIEQEKIVKCMKEINEKNIGFHDMVMRLPKACKDLKADNFSYFMFWGFYYVFEDYQNASFNQGRPDNRKFLIIDDEGILSDHVLYFALNLLKIFDQTIEIDGKKGLEALWKTLNKLYVGDNPRAKIHRGALKSVFEIINLFNENETNFQDEYENGLIKELTDVKLEKIKRIANDLSSYLIDYTNNQDKLTVFQENNSCESYFDFDYGLPSCPNSKFIKDEVTELIKLFKRKYSGEPYVLEEILNLFYPGVGVTIPFDNPNGSRKHFITIDEIARFFFDTEERSKKIKYKLKNMKKYTKRASLGRQLELIIRDIGFSGNFYGAFFANEASKATTYQELVLNNFDLLKRMDQFGGALRLIGYLPKETKWIAPNLIQTYMALYDIADEFTNPITGEKYSHSDFMQSILAAETMTSRKDLQNFEAARWGGWFPIKPNDNTGDNHNSMFAVRFARLSFISNMTRFLKDRVTTNRKEYFELLAEEEFQRIDKKLVHKFDLFKISKVLRNLIDNYSTKTNNELFDFAETMVDWVYNLDYQTMRTAERMIYDIVVIATYIGEDSVFPKYKDEYKDNNLNIFLDSLETVVSLWKDIKSNWNANNLDFKKIIPILAKQTKMIRLGLSSKLTYLEKGRCENSDCKKLIQERRERYYRLLNDTTKISIKMLFDSENPGYKILALKFKHRAYDWVKTLKNSVFKIYDSLVDLHFVNKANGEKTETMERFKSLAVNLKRIISHPRLEIAGFNEFLLKTIKETRDDGSFNPHYAEISKISYYLLERDDQNDLNFNILFDNLFGKQYANFVKFFEFGMTELKFDDVKK